MTYTETVAAFKGYIDQYTTGRAKDVDLWINEAIESYVKMRIGNNPAAPINHFESNQRVRDDLATLAVIDAPVPIVINEITYPANCYELIANTVKVTAEGVGQIVAIAKSIGWINANLKSSFFGPKAQEGRLYYTENDGKIYLFPVQTYTTAKVSYIKTWAKFAASGSVPIPLASKTHQAITKLAAAKYLRSVNNFDAAQQLWQDEMIE